MPCRSYEDEYPNTDYKVKEQKLKESNDNLAALLCMACKLLDDHSINFPLKLKTWWTKHQEADAKAQELEEKKLMAQLAKHEAAKREEERKAAEIRKLLNSRTRKTR